MTVYIDELRPTVPNANWRYRQACHMTADTGEELHKMARELGLRFSWFQTGKYPHYDLTATKRLLAQKLGAKEITAREWIRRTSEPHDLLCDGC